MPPGLVTPPFPGQPVPVLDSPVSGEHFPNIQLEPPLTQLEAISSCPVVCYLGEESSSHLGTQLLTEPDKLSWNSISSVGSCGVLQPVAADSQM